MCVLKRCFCHFFFLSYSFTRFFHSPLQQHTLTTSRMEKYVIPFLLFMLGSELRHRLKLHNNPKTIIHDLETFGIHRSVLPKDIGGTSIYNHEHWIEERIKQDI